jgi:hypothetical protein
MEGMEPPMRIRVKYPAARWQILVSLAALSDPDYQNTVWVQGVMPNAGYFDSLSQTISSLFDDWAVLPDPSSAVGSILVAGQEVASLRTLGVHLSGVIDDLGDRADDDYVTDTRWPRVVELAGRALSAMILAGPFDGDQSR